MTCQYACNSNQDLSFTFWVGCSWFSGSLMDQVCGDSAGVSSGSHKDETSSSQEQLSAPGGPSNQAPSIRPPLYPRQNAVSTAHVHQNLQNSFANVYPETQRVASSADTSRRSVLHEPHGAYMPRPKMQFPGCASPMPSMQ